MPDSVVIISIALGAIVAAAFLMAGLGYAAWRFGKGLGVSTRRSLSSRRPDRVGPTIVLVEETEDPEALDELAKNWRKATPPWRQRIRRLGIMLLGASILCNVAAAVVVLEQSISIEDEIVAYATRQAVAEEALRAAIGTVMSDPSALDPDYLADHPELLRAIGDVGQEELAQYLVTVWVAQQAVDEGGIAELGRRWLISIGVALLAALAAILAAASTAASGLARSPD